MAAPDFGAWIARLEGQLQATGAADSGSDGGGVSTTEAAAAADAAAAGVVAATAATAEAAAEPAAEPAATAEAGAKEEEVGAEEAAAAAAGGATRRRGVEGEAEEAPAAKIARASDSGEAPASDGATVAAAGEPPAADQEQAGSGADGGGDGGGSAVPPFPVGRVGRAESQAADATAPKTMATANAESQDAAQPAGTALGEAAAPEPAAAAGAAAVGADDPVSQALAFAAEALAAAELADGGGAGGSSSSSAATPRLSADDDTKTAQWAQVFAAFQGAGCGSRAKEFARVLQRLGRRSRELTKVCKEAVAGEDQLFQGAFGEASTTDSKLSAEVLGEVSHADSSEEAKTAQWGKIFDSLIGAGKTERAQEYHQALGKLLSDIQQVLGMLQDSTAAEGQLFHGAYQEALKRHRASEQEKAARSEEARLRAAYEDAIRLQMQAHRQVVGLAGKWR